MTDTIVNVGTIPAIERHEAMDLAAAEYRRFLDLLRSLDPEDWARPTDCELWDVRLLVAHMVGNTRAAGSMAETARQQLRARRLAKRDGVTQLDAMTAVQVRAWMHLDPTDLVEALSNAVDPSIAGRRRTPGFVRNLRVPLPSLGRVPLSYLFDIIFTRDTWMHRVDVRRATDRPMVLTAEHDGRIVADVVADWARRHGQPFTLRLGGAAGATFVQGDGGEHHELDAVEFCRILSGRAQGTGLLTTEVPF